MQARFSLLLSFFLFAFLGGCDQDQKEAEPPAHSSSETQITSDIQKEPKMPSPDNQNVSPDETVRLTASRNYALNMFRQLNAQEVEKNLLISPLSIEYMMAMLMSGADEKSSKEIAKGMNLPDITAASLNQMLSQNMQLHQQKANDDSQLLLANGIFVKKPNTIKTDYQKQMADLYQAKIQAVNKNDAAVINNWIKEQTKKRITHAVDNPVADTTLVNTVYFKGKWPEDHFKKEATKKRPFQGAKEQKNIPTMVQGGLKHYYEDQNVQALYQPYKGNDYAMLLLLPKGQSAADLDNFVSTLDESYFTKIYNNAHSPGIRYKGTLYLPKFETRYDNDKWLEQSRKLLGVDLGQCRFPNIINEAPLAVSKMLQIANITVNEEGTEAAAVTVVIAPTAAPPDKITSFEMDINHPFAYAIMDQAGNIVFIGTVKDIR